MIRPRITIHCRSAWPIVSIVRGCAYCIISTRRALFSAGEFARAGDYFSRSLDILKTNPFKRYHATLLLSQVGLVFCAEGAHAQALEYFVNSLRLDEEMNHRQAAAQTMGRIGWVYIYQNNTAMALDYAERSLKTMELLNDHAGVAFAHHLLGHIYYVQKDYDRALRHYEIALSLRQAIRAPSWPPVPSSAWPRCSRPRARWTARSAC